MQAHIISLHTSSTPGMGLKRQTVFFPERSHVKYQIKANEAQGNMQCKHTFCDHTHLDP